MSLTQGRTTPLKLSLPMTAPFIALSRHRLTVDGVGVTTLAAFHGCPLRCRYCLNHQCWAPEGVWREMTPAELIAELSIDDLYFRATGGGVCFGGGEPLLRSAFVTAFAEARPEQWRLYVETSLHVPSQHLEALLPYVDHYYVDVKDLNPDIYRQYTDNDIAPVLHNLDVLCRHRLQQRVTVRLPLIAGYNTDADRQRSRQLLSDMGFTDFDLFDYVIG